MFDLTKGSDFNGSAFSYTIENQRLWFFKIGKSDRVKVQITPETVEKP